AGGAATAALLRCGGGGVAFRAGGGALAYVAVAFVARHSRAGARAGGCVDRADDAAGGGGGGGGGVCRAGRGRAPRGGRGGGRGAAFVSAGRGGPGRRLWAVQRSGCDADRCRVRGGRIWGGRAAG